MQNTAPRSPHRICVTLPLMVLVCSLLPAAAKAQFIQQGPKLVGTGAVKNGYIDVSQGDSVALSGDGNTAIVGGQGDNDAAGAAWVFTRSAGVWTQQAKLVGTDTVGAPFQGASVSLSG